MNLQTLHPQLEFVLAQISVFAAEGAWPTSSNNGNSSRYFKYRNSSANIAPFTIGEPKQKWILFD